MCPICKDEEKKYIGIPKVEPRISKILAESYSVVQCRNCELYYVYPKINFTSNDWKLIYDENYFSNKSKWYQIKRVKDCRKRILNLKKYSKGTNSKFLDIGCGEGYALIESHRIGWNTSGLDISDNRISAAKDKSIIFYISDLISAKLPGDNYTNAYLDSVLEHVINPFEYLIEINRIMEKGGVIYIGVPNEDSLLNDFRKIIFKLFGKKESEKIKPFQSPYHINGFNHNSLRYIVENSGFEIIKMNNFACRIDFLKYRFLSKEFLFSLALLPVYLMAYLLKKEVYFEVYARK